MADANYQVERIDDSAWRIEENGVRCFLVAGSQKAMLVDTGYGTGDLRAVVAGLTDLPVMLVTSHADGDHFGAHNQFETAHMHPAEFDRYHRRVGAGKPAEPLWEDVAIDLGGRCFRVILIPGHTPGSIALLDEENRVLIPGDSASAATVYMFGEGRDMMAYMHSMRRLAALDGRFDTVWPSHGPFPLQRSIFRELAAGAEAMLQGKVQGTPAGLQDPDVKSFDVGAAKFLCK